MGQNSNQPFDINELAKWPPNPNTYRIKRANKSLEPTEDIPINEAKEARLIEKIQETENQEAEAETQETEAQETENQYTLDSEFQSLYYDAVETVDTQGYTIPTLPEENATCQIRDYSIWAEFVDLVGSRGLNGRGHEFEKPQDLRNRFEELVERQGKGKGGRLYD